MHDLLVINARVYPMAGDVARAAEDSIAVTDGRITAVGATGPAAHTLDAGGRVVMPGFVDCHTHIVYAGDRMAEHVARLEGASYEEIARAGGGIATTMRAVRAATIEGLVEASIPRVQALIREGVTCIEVKSGYGLDTDAELKMLEAIRALGKRVPIDVIATFLGAHAVPPGDDRTRYLDEVVERMLPEVAARKLAAAVDIFVEHIGFEVNDMRRLFRAAEQHGLAVKAHVEQLSHLGGTRIAAGLGALSCDHLEYADDGDIAAMARSGTVAVLLPGAFYFLRETRVPPVAALREHGVPIALATDANPGSSPVISILAMLHMGCVLFGLTPAEALLGVTAHAARALGLQDEAGSLEPGKKANFTVWDIPGPEFLTYQLGGVQPQAIYVEGRRL